MIVFWASCVSNYYQLSYLASTFDQVYKTAFCIVMADYVNVTLSGFMIEKFGTQKTLFYSFSISTIGGLLILTYGLKNQDSVFFPILFFISRFGIGSAFCTCYYGNTKVFPKEVLASSLGMCQIAARMFGSIQFFITTVEQPTPMILFTFFASLSTILSLLLKEQQQNDKVSQ